MIRYILLTVLLALVAGCAKQPGVEEQVTANAKFILIVGDGMDDQQITIARNYLHGSQGRMVLDDMPYRGSAQVRALVENDPGTPDYVGDSASGGTALATGVVTSVGRIGTTAQSDIDVVNIMELARAAGIGTGIVTTARVTDATPASFIAHVSSRYCDGPEDMVYENKDFPQDSTDCGDDYQANGGAGSIVEQIAASDMDIILGGGADSFDKFIEGSDTTSALDVAIANGFALVGESSELKNLEATGKVLGLFSAGTMPVRYRGVGGRRAEFLERDENSITWPEPFSCEENPEFANVPTLVEMTHAALNHLDGENGFMLMIESSSIDKEAHYRNPCGHIGEMGQIDEAVKVALEYAASHPETLILVTADHGQAAHIVPQVSDLAQQNYASAGRFARILTPEGGIMGINYATSDSPFWEEHTGVHVPVYASGPGVDSWSNFIQQADVFHIAAKHLGLGDVVAEE
jgi:alkaline phosphatase